MTNREWLETLSDEMLASEISTCCGLCVKQDLDECSGCVSSITTWMTQEYVPPKKEFTQDQLNKAFKEKFQDRRVLSLYEIENAIRGLFE